VHAFFSVAYIDPQTILVTSSEAIKNRWLSAFKAFEMVRCARSFYLLSFKKHSLPLLFLFWR
jgi:hypothetical protein